MRIAAFLTVALLTGCANLSTTAFDPVEYNHWVQVSHVAKRAADSCGKPDALIAVSIVAQQVELAALYSDLKISNPQIGKSAEIMNNFAAELHNEHLKRMPTATYCKLKLQIIDKSARHIAESLSKKES